MPLKQIWKEDFWVRVKFKITNHNQTRLDIYLTSIYYTFTTIIKHTKCHLLSTIHFIFKRESKSTSMATDQRL